MERRSTSVRAHPRSWPARARSMRPRSSWERSSRRRRGGGSTAARWSCSTHPESRSACSKRSTSDRDPPSRSLHLVRKGEPSSREDADCVGRLSAIPSVRRLELAPGLAGCSGLARFVGGAAQFSHLGAGRVGHLLDARLRRFFEVVGLRFDLIAQLTRATADAAPSHRSFVGGEKQRRHPSRYRSGQEHESCSASIRHFAPHFITSSTCRCRKRSSRTPREGPKLQPPWYFWASPRPAYGGP